MRCRLNNVAGATTYGDRAWCSKDDWDNQSFVVMEKLRAVLERVESLRIPEGLVL